MKLVFVRNLEENDILAKDIYDEGGRLLMKKATVIGRDKINFLKKNLVFYVYVEDALFEDIRIDEELDHLKSNALDKMPELFYELISGDYINSKKSLKAVEDIVDHIIDEGGVNTNLYEVKVFDNYTYIHCVDTCIMAGYLGMAMGYTQEKLKELCISAILHDIGKTKIPSEIINKTGKLTMEEFEEIKRHPIYGRIVLSNTNMLSREIIQGVMQHHERIDGKGYPFGLKGDQISEFAKIISICDVFTALSANRSYRKRFNPNEAYEYILAGANTAFDTQVVQRFRETFSIYPLGCCVKLSNGIEGYVVNQNNQFADRPIIRVVYDHNTKEPIMHYEINLLDNYDVVITEVVQ